MTLPDGAERIQLDPGAKTPPGQVRRVGANLNKRGGRLIRGARAKQFLMTDGRCTVVAANTMDGEATFQALAVVIAGGGFQSYPELLA